MPVSAGSITYEVGWHAVRGRGGRWSRIRIDQPPAGLQARRHGDVAAGSAGCTRAGLQSAGEFRLRDAQLARGEQIYAQNCTICHEGGRGMGGFPDLRTTPMMQSTDVFKAIVYDGALTENGMNSFKKTLTPEDVEAVRSHIVRLANDFKSNPRPQGFGPGGGAGGRGSRRACAGGAPPPTNSPRRACTSSAGLPSHSFFPTRIHAATLPRGRFAELNSRLQRECLQLAHDDVAGQRWSRRNYPGGFTSYASAHQMHRMSPIFARLVRWIDREVAAFRGRAAVRSRRQEARDDGLLGERDAARGDRTPCTCIRFPWSAARTTCACRRARPGLKFEDPRLDRYMGAPPRRVDADLRNRNWVIAARGARRPAAVRELAAPRGGGQHGRRRSHQHQFQLRLVEGGSQGGSMKRKQPSHEGGGSSSDSGWHGRFGRCRRNARAARGSECPRRRCATGRRRACAARTGARPPPRDRGAGHAATRGPAPAAAAGRPQGQDGVHHRRQYRHRPWHRARRGQCRHERGDGLHPGQTRSSPR